MDVHLIKSGRIAPITFKSSPLAFNLLLALITLLGFQKLGYPGLACLIAARSALGFFPKP